MGDPSYCVRGGRRRKPLLQGFPSSLLSRTKRGTQDSNLESPVLETDDTGLGETGAFPRAIAKMSVVETRRIIQADAELAVVASQGHGFVIDPFNRR